MSLALRFAWSCVVLTALSLPGFTRADTPPAAGRELKAAAPESVGFSSERLKRLEGTMQGLVDSKDFAGMVTLGLRHGKVVHSKSYGVQEFASGKPMAKDAIFRIYSMTKPVAGVAMMILYEEGKWQPDQPIARYIPEFANLKVFAGLDAKGEPILEAPTHPPTMGELLSHTAGFTYGVFGQTWVDEQYTKPDGIVDRNTLMFTTKSLQELIDKVATYPLLHQPGTRWEYSISVDIQAYIIEKLSGKKMPDFLRERIFEPLGMKDTAYYVPADKLPRLAALYQFDVTQKALAVRPQPPDPGTMPDMPTGGLGLYSTAMDYARFAQMLLDQGQLDGVRILAPRTVQLMRSNHLPERVTNKEFGGGPGRLAPGVGFGYDFGIQIDPFEAGSIGGAGTFSWAGAAGTWFWIDPELDVVFVGMVQRWMDLVAFEMANVSRATFYQALVDPKK